MSGGSKGKSKMISYAKYGYIFILPFFLAYAFFMIYPLIYTAVLSFQGNGASQGTFVGFQNYGDLLFGGEARYQQANHSQFINSLGVTAILWLGNFVVQIILSLLLAVWFSDVRIKVRGAGFFKVAMYLPNIITAASVASMFLMLFDISDYGAVNSILKSLGLIKESFPFIDNVWSSRILVMLIQSWMWYGNTMLLLMSGIFGIDPSIYEAASIDGSSGGYTFFHITLPILKPIFIYVVITSMIGGLQMFDIPYLLHTGDHHKSHLETTAVYIYKNFVGTAENDGYSAAASMIMFLITAVLGFFIYKFNSDNTAPKKAKKK